MTADEPRPPRSPRAQQVDLPPVQEWDDPDDMGADLLDEVLAALTRYVAFPSREAADAVTLFIAATHAQPSWEHATRLVIKSPMRQCGKTRLLEVTVELVHKPLPTTNISTAALVRSIDDHDPPSILLDECDAIFATRRGERSEGAEDLRGILNSGHARGWPYMRWDANARKLDACPTFAMAVLAGIGDMPDTIEDRAVIITMRRRTAGEDVERFRRKRAVPPLKALRHRLHRWVRSIGDDLAKAEPDLPVDDRPADVWEPLVAIADAAGGHWPDRARDACAELTGTGRADEPDGTRLLADVRHAFGGADRLTSADLLAKLNADETSPWGGWRRGEGLNSRDLAKLLKPYEVAPKVIKMPDGTTPRGYTAEMFADAWARYVSPSRPLTRNERNERNEAGQGVAPPIAVAAVAQPETDRNAVTREVTQVAQVAQVRPDGDTCGACPDGEPVPGSQLCIDCASAGTLTADELAVLDPGWRARDAAIASLREGPA